MKYLTFVLLLFVCASAQAQKENNVWVGGYWSGIDFNNGLPTVFKRLDNDDHIWRTNASICDSAGNLLFYTNGYRVFNRNFQVMQNGNNLNIGDFAGLGNNELSVPDGAAIVPAPGSPGKYYVFHTDLNFTNWEQFTNLLMPTHLFYSIVDMNLANGLGGIAAGKKDILLLSDTLIGGGFKLAKHGNGQDYWLLCHEAGSKRYYRFLIDPQGVHGPFEQYIGNDFTGFDATGSPLQFDINDNKAIQLYNNTTAAILYNFNRCTGEFSSPEHFVINDTLYETRSGAFSESGRYFYANASLNYIWQFDLTAPDIAASRKQVAHYSGATNPFPTDFADMELAPDGKIYVNSWDGNHSLHVIHFPDSSAELCGFVENGLQLDPPGWSWAGMPNTVHYGLGPLYGSGCDTLTSTKALPQPVFTFGVYPNPFSSQFQISVSGVNTNALVEVCDVLGQKEFAKESKPINSFIHQAVDLTNYANGVYFVSIDVNGQRYTRKVVKR